MSSVSSVLAVSSRNSAEFKMLSSSSPESAIVSSSPPSVKKPVFSSSAGDSMLIFDSCDFKSVNSDLRSLISFLREVSSPINC